VTPAPPPASGWRKPSRSVSNGACVEVGAAGTVQVRDTADRDGAVLEVSKQAWETFTGGLSGEAERRNAEYERYAYGKPGIRL